MISRGYQPTRSNLNPANPPQGGTGVRRSITVIDVKHMKIEEIERLLFAFKAELMNRRGELLVNGKEIKNDTLSSM